MSAANERQTTPDGIWVRGLARRFRRREVVRGIDLNFSQNEIVGLLGPNGAGKTTTFNLVAGILRPTRGDIFLGETNITRRPLHQRARLGISFLPQEPSVFRRLTVAQNLLAVLETQKRTKQERHRLADAQLAQFQLENLRDQRAETLSGGERRRLEIARALLLQPKFLLLDEPFSGVDPKSVAEVQSLIEGLRAAGIGVVLTDHNVREALRIVDRAYLLFEGSILAEGTPKEIAADADVRRHYLGEAFVI